jgi:hypothetical protein
MTVENPIQTNQYVNYHVAQDLNDTRLCTQEPLCQHDMPYYSIHPVHHQEPNMYSIDLYKCIQDGLNNQEQWSLLPYNMEHAQENMIPSLQASQQNVVIKEKRVNSVQVYQFQV